MPLFIPINPPEAASAQSAGASVQSPSLIRVEEEIRGLLHEYQTALRLWAKGCRDEAYRSFDELSSKNLVARVQDPQTETECDAHCREYGGISIDRLRSLVFANAGQLQMIAAGVQCAWKSLAGLDTQDPDATPFDVDPRKETLLRGALAKLEMARAFDGSDTAHHLAVGWCALQLGRLDIAVSAFLSSATLMRGDVEMAAKIVEQATHQNPALGKMVQRLLDSTAKVPSRISEPPVLYVPRALLATEPGTPNPHRTVTVRDRGGRVALSDLSDSILAQYRWSIESDAEAGSNTLLDRVEFKICAETTTTIQRMVIDGEPAMAPSNAVDTDDKSDNPLPVASAEATDSVEPEMADSGPETTAKHEIGVPLKRASSFSEDELPMKRRSARFSERTSTGVLSGTLAGAAGGVQAISSARPANARGTGRQPLSTLPEATSSEAFEQASECASTWFGLANANDEMSFADMLERYLALTGMYTGRSSSRQRSNLESDVRSEWNLPTDTRNGRVQSASALEDILSSMTGIAGEYAPALATSVAKQTSNETASNLAPGSESHYSIKVEGCVRLFADNRGAVDMLVRCASAMLDALSAALVVSEERTQLKHALLRILLLVHEILLAQANADLTSGSLDSQRRGIRRGTAVVLVLAESAVGDARQHEQSVFMRRDWTLLISSAISRLQLSEEDPCAAQFCIAKAWTDYELAVAVNDLDAAASSISVCCDLLQQHQQQQQPSADHAQTFTVWCSSSDEPVTLELAKQHQTRLAWFDRLREAVRLARTDAKRAIAILAELADRSMGDATCLLAFPQRIAVVRLLAALCRQQTMAVEEARAVAHELHLYLSQLLARLDDNTLPMRRILRRCTDCLRTIHRMATGDKQVAQSLEGTAAGLSGVRLAAQLLAMLLALAKHFAIDPAPDSPANSMEAMFVGLAAWLVAALGSSTDVDTPASAGNCSQAQSSCSEDAEPLEPYVQLLDSIHRLLGERGLCTAADGAFLKHMLYACRTRAGEDAKLPARWNVIGSILRCLFDIKLHGCGAPHHPSAHIEMDSASANLTYLLVETELLDTLRNRKDASMRSDLKAIVDKTSGALADIDAAQHPRVAMNMDVIDDYLDGTAMPTFAQIDQALRSESAPVLVACVPPVEPSASMPAACVTLPFVRATTQHDTLRFRMRAGMARAVEDYDDILEDYKLHVSLHPASAEAWLHLGQAHSDLADELLLGTAAEILECKHDIAVLQRAALACLVQAKQLLEPLATDLSSTRSSNVEDHEQQHRLHIRVYSLAGRLIYRIAARPLPLLALQVLPSNILVANDDNSHQEWDLGRWRDTSAHALSRTLSRRYTALPPRRHIYELARVMLYRASRLDPGNWKWPYLVGKTAAKLLEPLTACALYLKASHLAAAEDSSSDLSGTTPAAGGPISEVAIDSMYKLLSALTKLLSSHQIDAVTAQRFVDALPYSVPLSDASTVVTNGAHCCINAPPAPSLNPSSEHTFASIRRLLEHMCAADKRRWHHRSVFWLAWMDHHLFGNPKQAKQALLTLLQMRNTNKQLASFYKTDFEAPGKHYVYLEKYLRLYIETLTATHDIDGLQLLVRKLRRSAGSLYDPPALLQETIRAETEALLGMVCALNCPKFVVDAGGREHIVLQSDLVGADVVQTHAVFRHCRLNRTQFNYARDYARESIASFAALHQRVATVLGSEKTPELAVAHDALAQMQPAVECYLETANKAITLFGHLMEQRKLTDDAATLSRLNDGLADLYVMVLSVYGQSKCSAPLPAHHGSMDALVAACREATDLLAHTPHLTRSESSFWRCIIFDDNRHESPQQYKLLDPLLEFQINKLIDAVRDARLQPPMASPEAPQGNIAAQTLAHLPPAPDAVPSTVSDAVPDAVPDVAMQ
ncbi:Histone transcription regulator 3 [Coemansia sp. RSA 2611]|nr:Histone transcription regulator 3 [Coemansia sp. RSA 2611]